MNDIIYNKVLDLILTSIPDINISAQKAYYKGHCVLWRDKNGRILYLKIHPHQYLTDYLSVDLMNPNSLTDMMTNLKLTIRLINGLRTYVN